ncbi:MAG: hypothetical protein COA84_01750 [Robiginitomaculum sp.]|nr:MAG: hypothetical protein COA84_01750 [Robiginitomaculum sp.]
MTTVSEKPATSVRIYRLGMSLGIFLAISFALCVALGVLVPGAHMYESWLPLLPGVTWISLPSFLLGLVETFAYGWYIALVFVPVYNFFTGRA